MQNVLGQCGIGRRAVRAGAVVVLVAGLGAGWLVAADPEPTGNRIDARLREQLRTTTFQVRDLQDQLAMLQAAQAEKDRERANLTAQVSTLTRRSAAEREEAAKQQTKLAAKDEEIARLTAELERWKASSIQAVELAQSTEAERARLAQRIGALERTVADREAKNVALVKVAIEILERYQKETARRLEPILGLRRVDLENLVQGYADKIADQKYSLHSVKQPEAAH